MPALVWDSCCVSHQGKVRPVNEDACLAQPETGLWAVADGMGGHAAGELASRAVIESLRGLPVPPHLGIGVTAVEARLGAVNGRLLEEAHRREVALMGSTVVVLIACGGHAVYLWVGDSRIYLFRDGELHQLSRDHSLVEEELDAGAPPREGSAARTARNVITRALGGTPNLDLEAEILEVRAGDLYLLCSDGLPRELSDPEIAALLTGNPGVDTAHILLDRALERGGRDNVTVMLVAAAAAPSPPSRQS